MTVLVFLITFILVYYLYFHWKILKKYDNLPGPRPRWPLIGNLHLVLKEQGSLFHAYFHTFVKLRKLYAKEGIFVFYNGSSPLITVHNPNIIERVLKSNLVEKSVQYDYFKIVTGEGLFTCSAINWKKRRNLLMPAFHFDVFQQFIPMMNSHTKNLIKMIETQSNEKFIDVNSIVSNYTFRLICETSMGLKFEEISETADEYLKTIDELKSIMGKRLTTPFYWIDFIFNRLQMGKDFYRHGQSIRNFCKVVVTERKRLLQENEKNSDCDDSDCNQQKTRLAFLDLLIKIQKENNSFTDEDIYDEVGTFAFAGYDTTAMFLIWILLVLGNYPDVQERLRKEQNEIFGENDKETNVTRENIGKFVYMNAVIKEALRLYPSIPMIARKLAEPIDIDDFHLPKGSNVMIPIYFLHRDENIFPQHKNFSPERFLDKNVKYNQWQFMPFSNGARNCIGSKYALYVSKIFLSFLIRNFSLTSSDHHSNVEKSFGVTLTPVEAKIKFTNY